MRRLNLIGGDHRWQLARRIRTARVQAVLDQVNRRRLARAGVGRAAVVLAVRQAVAGQAEVQADVAAPDEGLPAADPTAADRAEAGRPGGVRVRRAGLVRPVRTGAVDRRLGRRRLQTAGVMTGTRAGMDRTGGLPTGVGARARIRARGVEATGQVTAGRRRLGEAMAETEMVRGGVMTVLVRAMPAPMVPGRPELVTAPPARPAIGRAVRVRAVRVQMARVRMARVRAARVRAARVRTARVRAGRVLILPVPAVRAMAASLAEELGTAVLVQMGPERVDPPQVAPAISIGGTRPATDAQVQAVPAASIAEMPPATDAQVRAAPVTEVRLAEELGTADLVTLHLGIRGLEMAESRVLAPHERVDPATLTPVAIGPVTTGPVTAGRPAEAAVLGTAARAAAITAAAITEAARAAATTEAAEPAAAGRLETHRVTAAPRPADLATTAGQDHALARDRPGVTTPGPTVIGLGAELAFGIPGGLAARTARVADRVVPTLVAARTTGQGKTTGQGRTIGRGRATGRRALGRTSSRVGLRSCRTASRRTGLTLRLAPSCERYPEI